MGNQDNLPTWAQELLETLPPLLTRREAHTTARCSARYLDRNLDLGAADGGLTPIRVGSRVLIARGEFCRWLANRPPSFRTGSGGSGKAAS